MRKLALILAAVLARRPRRLAPATATGRLGRHRPQGRDHRRGHDAAPRRPTASNADQIYAEAIKYTYNVVQVYSPNATWSKVKAAVNGASIIVYLGHGNGWPSPYTYDPKYTTKDGFGLNYDLNGDGKLTDYENKYYGEPSIRTLTPAPERGGPAVPPLLRVRQLRAGRRGAEPRRSRSSASTTTPSAFLAAGARAVIANGHSHDPYYIRALFTTRQTIEQYWRNAPDFHNHVLSVPVRTVARLHAPHGPGLGLAVRLLPLDDRQDVAHDRAGDGRQLRQHERRPRHLRRAGQRQPRAGRRPRLRQPWRTR